MVILIWGIEQARSIVIFFLISIFISILGISAMHWLERKHIPSTIAVFIVVGSMIIIVLFIGAVVGTSINKFLEALPFYQTTIIEQVISLQTLLAEKGIKINEELLFKYINIDNIMSLTAKLLTGLGTLLSNIFIILLMFTFILLESSSFLLKFKMLFNDSNKDFNKFSNFINNVKRYMVIKTIVSLITGFLIGLWLYIIGVDLPILWGFIAFALNYIPNVGSIIAAIPAILLSLVQLGAGSAIQSAVGYIVVNFSLGNIIEPRLMGRKLGLSTLVVVVSLIFWGKLLGPIGAVLSIPLTMVLKLAFENSENTHWIAVLLGPELPPKNT
ncbi:MAG TPA: hypothetical protein DCP53_07165 [Elusimicrobia bacterium]|nr:hypothetical protein [Elusimicrobiota bacterium]